MLRGMIFHKLYLFAYGPYCDCMREWYMFYKSYSAWVSRCSFNYIGQCESLWMWDGQLAQIPTSFLYVDPEKTLTLLPNSGDL